MEIHHRRSIRLSDYDYSQDGFHYVTICVNRRRRLLGEIHHGIMCLSNIGSIVQDVWNKIPEHYSCIDIDTFQIMPNHIHGIIIINKFVGAGLSCPGREVRAPTLGQILGYFKYQTTKQYNDFPPFRKLCQRNYWEHIIRNDEDYFAARQYEHLRLSFAYK